MFGSVPAAADCEVHCTACAGGPKLTVSAELDTASAAASAIHRFIVPRLVSLIYAVSSSSDNLGQRDHVPSVSGTTLGSATVDRPDLRGRKITGPPTTGTGSSVRQMRPADCPQMRPADSALASSVVPRMSLRSLTP